MLRKIKYFFLLLAIGLSSVTIYYYWQSNLPLVSPVALIETIIGNYPQSTNQKIVYGFFPYWNLKYVNQLNINELTHFAYFAIDLNPDGSINKKVNSKELEPGWNKLNSKEIQKLLYQVKLLNKKTVITVTAMDQELIESIVDNPQAAQTAINSIMDVYHDFFFDDINVDFEYVGTPNDTTRQNFTSFVSLLRKACLQANPSCKIDVDIFADTATKTRLHDLEKLVPVTDRFIVMAYDYYRKSSSQAGPVAPILGKCSGTSDDSDCLEMDIMNHLSVMSKIIPKEKIILGVPFYGYQWQTASTDFLANTYRGSGSVATYQRIQTIFSDPTISSLSASWSAVTLSPYLTFNQDGDTYQIHYENAESLGLKISLIKSANLGGVAIWALGYEVPYPDLWRPIYYLNHL